jgi:GH18 family chitinase
LVVLALFGIVHIGTAQNNRMWVTAYYPLWAVPSMYPEDIEYAGITHIVHFSANPVRTPPYLDVLVRAPDKPFNQDSINIQFGGVYNGNNPPLWRTIDIQQSLIARAHDANVKVILSVGGIYGVGAETMSWITKDPERVKTFATSSCEYAKRKGYDGIELDWEFPRVVDKLGFNMLIRAFRDKLNSWKPRGIFIAAVHECPGSYFAYEKDSLLACFDQINPMTYEMYAGDFSKIRTGYNTPLDSMSEFPGYNGYGVNQNGHGPRSWIENGYPASRIGLGISFLTTEFYGVTSPVQPAQAFINKNWGYFKNVPVQTRHWDGLAKVPWAASGTTFYTYEDTASIRAKVSYAKSLNLGGIMIYDLLGGYLPSAPHSQKHPLLKAVLRASD